MTQNPTPLPYAINEWGQEYFSSDENGQLMVSVSGQNRPPVSFSDICEKLPQEGLRLPVLLRFKDILHDCVNRLVESFNQAINTQHYQGAYQIVYPIKVNQQRRVIEEIVQSEPAATNQQIGLEAGSKPELLAVLALAPGKGTTIVCNGYKDKAYVRLALLGQRLGYHVHLVIEKASELPLIMEEAQRLNVEPSIGLRARLHSIGKGNWQNTGGEKSKFGLSSAQMLDIVNELADNNRLSCLRLLHFHLGSQIANIRDIQNGLFECARIYSQLRLAGAPITSVDIGGGLGIDYDGTQSRNVCSTNYSFEDYARCVVNAFKQCCDQAELPHPNLISESGRAITAHHAVLMTDIVAREKPQPEPVEPSKTQTSPALHQLWKDYLNTLDNTIDRSPVELYHDAVHALDDVHQQFIQGSASLADQAQAEQIYSAICLNIRQRLNPQHRGHQDLIDRLNEKLAEKLFVNFSVFQSVPDVWGIDQIFPITPITGLNQALNRHVIVQDITCDSDGRIDQYVSSEGLESTLRLPDVPDASDERLCFFLVGAYQEILGDMHNLFGDTDSVDVNIDQEGNITLEHPIRGDTVSDVLDYVNLNTRYLTDKYEALLKDQNIEGEQYEELMLAFEEGLESYTYLG